MGRFRTASTTVCVLLVLSSCSSGPSQDVEQASSTAEPEVSASSAPVASALEDLHDERFPAPLIDPDEVVSGGPPPDGIPPLDDPRFETAAEVTWLEDGEGVLSLTVGQETRAYPLRVMTWHEIVNDSVGGVPVAVTYCPLCNSGVAFEREVDGQVLDFGTSGMLYADNLVMYDRQSHSLWPQLTGEAAIGMMTGQRLTAIPMGTVAWSDFLTAHPDALVLSQDTGFRRPYGENPYVGYDDTDGSLLFPLPGEPDERLAVKERVVGVSAGSENVAVVREDLVGRPPVQLRVGGRHLVLWHAPGQRSALDAPRVAEGTQIGSVGVFDPVVDGQRLTFEAIYGGFRDVQTSSVWDVLGTAVEGELAGATLTPYPHLDTFWFAWVTFHPETDLHVVPAG